MRKIIFITAILVVLSPLVYSAKKPHDFYQLKIYHLKSNEQVGQVDQYLKDISLPALHRLGIKNVGVFKPIANDTAAMKLIYVLIPFNSADGWIKAEDALAKDAVYISSGKSFNEAPFDKAPYERVESILLDAFSEQQHLVLPAIKSPERVFELRSYESPTQSLAEKKMAMFNTGGEIAIFKRLGFNPVFYGRVVSGSRMPNFMYMPVFDNLQQKEAQWKTFGNDPQWKDISAKPENENKVAVSHIDSILMHSTPYSDY
ncbi:MAG: NIPSNAP family protein [Ginsengibacter sp.]